MIEGQFSENIQRWFKAQYPEGFVWKNETRFKAGFPDLTMIVHGRTTYAELKVIKEDHINIAHLMASFRPAQLVVIDWMVTAQAQVYGWVYYPKLKDVVQIDFKTMKFGSAPADDFKHSFRVTEIGTIGRNR